MGDRDTLRPTGRTRGVDDVGGVVRPERTNPVGVADRVAGEPRTFRDELVTAEVDPFDDGGEGTGSACRGQARQRT